MDWNTVETSSLTEKRYSFHASRTVLSLTIRAFEGLRPEQIDGVWMTVWGSVAFGYGEP
jgi:hypothetical protein